MKIWMDTINYIVTEEAQLSYDDVEVLPDFEGPGVLFRCLAFRVRDFGVVAILMAAWAVHAQKTNKWGGPDGVYDQALNLAQYMETPGEGFTVYFPKVRVGEE